MAVNYPNNIQVVFPAAASASWETATTDPSATGNTGTLPRFVENTVNGSKWYIDANGVAESFSYPLDQTDTFTATASQTAFTLSKSPIGKIYGYRNGVKLPTAWTWVDTAVTYSPTANGGKTIDANDVISFEYEAY
jgi:hypothetical protein